MLIPERCAKEAQFDLRIIGRNEHFPLAERHKAGSYSASEISTNRNIFWNPDQKRKGGQ